MERHHAVQMISAHLDEQMRQLMHGGQGADVRMLPPLTRPGKILCVGVNYPDRNAEYKDGSGAPQVPQQMRSDGPISAAGSVAARL